MPRKSGPFLTLSASGHRGRVVNRVVRSTNVPIGVKSDDEVAYLVLGLGGPLADMTSVAATTCGEPSARAAPARCAGRPSTRGAVPPAPGCTTLGRWPRAQTLIESSSTRSGADHAAGSTLSPNVGLAAATSTTPGPTFGRPVLIIGLRGGPGSSSADRSRPAWRSSGAWHVGRWPLRSRRIR